MAESKLLPLSEAIDRFVSDGSSIAMDYIFKSVVDGTSDLYGAQGFRIQVQKRGDPLGFGIEEGTVEGFFADRGFDTVKHLTSDAVKSAYFTGASRDIYVAPFLGYVHATVGAQNVKEPDQARVP